MTDTRQFDHISKNLKASEAGTIFVGFSGGADSTALLKILANFFAGKIVAVHFHHGLREVTAERDAQWCENFVAELNKKNEQNIVDFKRIGIDVPKLKHAGESIEEAARRLRLENWQKLATAKDLVALGHHHDDVVENFFIRLMRGSNSSGLTSLREHTEICGINIWRPLINNSREELHDYLKTLKVQWCHDETNDENDYLRNAIRNRLLPDFFNIASNSQGISHSLDHLAEEAQYLEEKARNLAEKLQNSSPLTEWQSISPALLPRVIKNWLKEKTGEAMLFNRHFYERFKAEIYRNSSEERQLQLPNGLSIFINSAGITLRKSNIDEFQLEWNWQTQNFLRIGNYHFYAETCEEVPENFSLNELYLPIKYIADTVVLRNYINGDRMTLFGSGFTRKLKKIFGDKSVPSSERRQIPLLMIGDDIIWIPGIARSALFTINKNQPQKLLKITYSCND